MTTTNPTVSDERPSASKGALGGWVLFDWAVQPFYTLVTPFIFAPYFVNVYVGDPIQGQALWGYGAAVAGIIVAILSPILGSVADASGRRKPWIAFFIIIFVIALCALWFAEPGMQSRLYMILGAMVVATACAEIMTVFTNSMMPALVPRSKLGRLSGIGWAVGYVGGMLSLVILAGLLVGSPDTGKTLLGLDPIVALDQQAHEGDRLSGPFSAVWLLLFVIPFFLLTPDVRSKNAVSVTPVADGLASLKQTFMSLGDYRNVAMFLVSRMLYIDGVAAIFTFGGIYAASVFSWGSFELGLFGIILTVAGALGAVCGGILDDKLGSKLVIVGALMGLIVASFGLLSVDKTHILFFVEVTEKAAGSAAFSSSGEKLYVAFGILIGIVAGPLQSASRTFLARLAPEDKITQFYGLYAFSGKITSFMAPFMVATVTSMMVSQRWGVASIIIFLLAGMILILKVQSETAED